MKTEHILEKGSGLVNEDTLILNKNIFGVFDGATSLDAQQFDDNKTGGMLAAQTAGQVFSKNHHPLLHLGCEANNAILSKMQTQQVDLNHRQGLWSTSAAVVRLTNDTVEWLQTGDAYIVVIYKDGSFILPVEKDDHDYDTLMMLKKNPCKNRPEFKDQIKKIRQQMNQTYGVLNGEPAAVDFIKTGSLPLENIQTILLFTDGLQLSTTTPKRRKNFSSLVSLFQKLGLKGLKNHIRKIEAKDPDVIHFPRFKCHDDIAAIAIHP